MKGLQGVQSTSASIRVQLMAALFQRTSSAIQLNPWWILDTFYMSPLNMPDLLHTVCIYQGHIEGVFPAVATQILQESVNQSSGDLGALSIAPIMKCQLPSARSSLFLAQWSSATSSGSHSKMHAEKRFMNTP